LLRQGYTVEQVVRDYGDVCQSITELAREQDLNISTAEFGVLNRCLDDAIAESVTTFGRGHQTLINERAETSQQRMRVFTDEYRRLVGIALQAFNAIKTGNVGVTGSTGRLLFHTLEDLRSLADRTGL